MDGVGGVSDPIWPGLVTNGIVKICCIDFILALF